MAPKRSSRPPPRSGQRQGESSRRHEESAQRRHRDRHHKRSSSHRPLTASDESRDERESHQLSSNALAELDRENARQKRRHDRGDRVRRPNRAEYREARQIPESPRRSPRKGKKRVVSGAVMEEGRVRSGLRGGRGHSSEPSWDEKDYYAKPPKKRKLSKKKKLWIIGGCSVLALVIIIAVAVAVTQKNKKSDDGDSSGSSGLDGKNHDDIPTEWKNTFLDPFTWATTEDFNTTFTDSMVGDLPVMGLFSDWDDSKKANSKVPALNEDWGSYDDRPARGVNLGGWLSLEPFIAPSLFDYPVEQGIIDEWTLSEHLGSSAQETIEKHYASFITEDTFKSIANAGLDHVRIPYSYWAVETYDGDPYVYRTSWRYLLRAIEWARKHGLRVNLDIHGIPGSQNGWNHSGRWGEIRWLNGTDGDVNAQRSLDIHDRLSKFFAQDRYKNIITHYGLCNEPRMTFLDPDKVMDWSKSAYDLVRKNGVDAYIVIGDGFMGLDNWQGKMSGYKDVVLDAHQYVIFNVDLIDFTHQKKVKYACNDWTSQAEKSSDQSTGFGPTVFAEWSQADTDCAKYLTGVGWGTRWEGTYDDLSNPSSSVTEPQCPAKDASCSCDKANADPSSFSDTYKKFLLMFAEAQMHSFEHGWGWWYWTWKTEAPTMWSYEAGLKAGVLPENAAERGFNCDEDVPDFAEDGLSEAY